MEDIEIVEMFLARNEMAIAQTKNTNTTKRPKGIANTKQYWMSWRM